MKKGEHIRELRTNQGMSRREFAEHFGIPVGTVRNWEQGSSLPAQYWIRLMENVLWYEQLLEEHNIEIGVQDGKREEPKRKKTKELEVQETSV